jgi:membrane protease subunit (stomatin/prohibitin family)
MIGRRGVVRRRPLARAAVVGGTFAAGRSMGRRAEQQSYAEADQAQQAQAQQQQAPPAQPSPSMMDQLNQLTTLHQQGALNDDEFAAAKAKILGS